MQLYTHYSALIVVAVAVEAPHYAPSDADTTLTFVTSGWAQMLGVIAFAFVCHENVFFLVATLKPDVRNVKGWSQVVVVATLIALGLCLALCIPSFLAFGQDTDDDIMNNFIGNRINAPALIIAGEISCKRLTRTLNARMHTHAHMPSFTHSSFY
jgi:sodium-coupled neutral amino acid transporter 11